LERDGSPDGNILEGDTSPTAVVERLQELMSPEDFEYLFPRRFGTPGWREHSHRHDNVDYYSYENLLEAIRRMASLVYEIEFRDHGGGQTMNWTSRAFVTNKATGRRTPVFENPGFNSPYNINRPVITQTVDFGAFLGRGSENDRRRELAAFLANTAHETTGGWETAPGGRFAWGLFFNEEVAFTGSTAQNYWAPGDPNFPPVPGRSYHGRGPIQLSWNYNYGLFSAIVFQDQNVLLQNPQRVVECGILGWQTALWFWMTPQSPKPSCHEVMTGAWIPTAQDTAAGRTHPGFGMTIMVINGGLEQNLTEADGRILSRVGFYRRIAARIGANISGEKLDTAGMTAAGWQ